VTAIVVPDRADKYDQAAATELERYLEAVLSVTFTITPEAAFTGAGAVYVGSTRRLQEVGADPSDMGTDALIMKCTGHDLFLAGNGRGGTRYAVCAFVEERLGVRWFLPSELFTIVPRREVVRLSSFSERQVPTFPYRELSGTHSGEKALYLDGNAPEYRNKALWAVRNKLSLLRECPSGGGHNMHNIFDPEIHGATSPGVYAEREGRRRVPRPGENVFNPCFSSPEAVRIAAAAACAFFEERSYRKYFSLCVGDSGAVCHCSACLEREGDKAVYRGTLSRSITYWDFVSKTAREVFRTHPAKRLAAYAYRIAEYYPDDVPMPPNAAITFCPEESEWFDPEYAAVDRENLARISNSAREVYLHLYPLMGWRLPRYYPHLMDGYLKFAKSRDAKGFYGDENRWGRFTMGPLTYIVAKLAWDATLDVDDLIDEFLDKLFQEAAPDVRAFYSRLEAIWMRPSRPARWFYGHDRVYEQVRLYSAADVHACNQALAAAANRARASAVKQRVEVVRNGWRVARSYAEQDFCHRRFVGLAPGRSTEALALVREADRIGAERARLVEQLVKQPIYNTLATWDDTQWDAYLQGRKTLAFARIATWLMAEAPGRIPALLGAEPAPEVHELLAFLKREATGEGNLVPNPGFEMTRKQSSQPESLAPAWEDFDADVWNGYTGTLATTSCARDAEAKHGGAFSGRITGGGGSLNQRIAVKPGRKYAITGWFCTDSSMPEQVRLDIRWFDKNGKWIWQPQFVAHLPPGTPKREWARLTVAFIPPQQAAYAGVIAGSGSIRQTEHVWMDDFFMAETPPVRE